MFKAGALLAVSLCLGTVQAHVAAWHKGMYCINGPTNNQDLNSNAVINPLYQLSFRDWWFHHVDRCDEYPPPAGDFVELPAGGQFTIEIASNRAKTSLSYGGRDTSSWPDGDNYPENYNVPTCITSPVLHAQNQSMAAGTAFAISYHSDIKDVTPNNLVVFTVRAKTPWKRILVYDVPADMPPCPPGGCICAWGWVPNGCGQPNMYHQAFKCRVTNSKSNRPVGTPKPPVWCEGNPGACTKGPKQMVYWNQAEGNNIQVSGFDQSGQHRSPGYNLKLGFADGAQNDIFTGSPPSGSSSGNPNPQPNASSGNNNNNNNNNSNNNPTATNNGTPTPTQDANANTDPSDVVISKPATGPISVKAPSCQKRRRRRSHAKKSEFSDAISAHLRRSGLFLDAAF